MDKQSLLVRLAQIRTRAEATHLETVFQRASIARLEKAGLDTTITRIQLQITTMAEQKHLKELDWILDQLE